MTQTVSQKSVVDIADARPRRSGPKTPAGKARCSSNALKHGLLAAAPVLDSENRADYEEHVAATIADLGAVGHVQELLATRAAQLFWRLARLTRYEVGVVRAAQPETAREARRALGEVSTRTRQLEDVLEFLQAPEDGEGVGAETAKLILWCVAINAGTDPDHAVGLLSDEPITQPTFVKLLRIVSQGAVESISGAVASVAFRLCVARVAVDDARKRAEEAEAAWLAPSGRATENLVRYEAHLQRALSKTLAELRALQDRRE